MTSDHFPEPLGDARAWDLAGRRICLLATGRLIHLDLTFSAHHIIIIIPPITPAHLQSGQTFYQFETIQENVIY